MKIKAVINIEGNEEWQNVPCVIFAIDGWCCSCVLDNGKVMSVRMEHLTITDQEYLDLFKEN